MYVKRKMRYVETAFRKKIKIYECPVCGYRFGNGDKGHYITLEFPHCPARVGDNVPKP
jgi:hypothetical protein